MPNTGDPEESRTSDLQERYAGIIEAMLLRWQHSHDHPTAIMAIDDNFAVSTIQIAQKMGYRVPEDLRIVGADDLAIGHLYGRPRFPTTRADFGKAGKIAAEFAFRQIRGDSVEPERSVLPVVLKTYELDT